MAPKLKWAAWPRGASMIQALILWNGVWVCCLGQLLESPKWVLGFPVWPNVANSCNCCLGRATVGFLLLAKPSELRCYWGILIQTGSQTCNTLTGATFGSSVFLLCRENNLLSHISLRVSYRSGSGASSAHPWQRKRKSARGSKPRTHNGMCRR